MSLKYAENKIREALRLAKGNTTRANQIIVAMAMKDMRLLQGLTKHHLNGIAAYHVDRVASGRTDRRRSPAPKAAANVAPQPSVKDNSFGAEILKSVVGENAQVFGFDNGIPQGPRKAASQDHINAIKQIASRSKLH